MTESKRNVRWGILSTAKIATKVSRAIHLANNAELVAVASRTEERAKSWASEHSVGRAYGSYEALLEDESLDAIYLPTPPTMHAEWTIKAAEHGKHVLCEKPLAVSTEEAVTMADACRENRVQLMDGVMWVHNQRTAEMKGIIDSGALGKLRRVTAAFTISWDKIPDNNIRAKKELAGGGILMDQGIHLLDLFIMMGGEFEEAMAFISNLYWNLDVEDNVFAIFRNSKTGVCASLHSTMTQWRYLFSLEVFLEGGALVLNGLKTSSGVYGSEDLAIKHNSQEFQSGAYMSEERLIYELDDSWEKEINAFFGAILNPDLPRIGNSSEAMKVMRLVDLVYQRPE